MIPLSIPSITGNEWKYVKESLSTGWVSSAGEFVEKFEQDVSVKFGAKHAVACVNGTAALQVALQIVGVMLGDEVIVPTLTFIASVNAAHYLGASPVFMDCDEFYNIDVAKTIRFINEETIFQQGHTVNKKTGKIIRAIVPVHVFGNAVDLEPLVAVCKERNIKVVEDAAESVGTRYIKGQYGGRYAGTIGDIGCYSFNGNKIITTGGGGMILTDSSRDAEMARYLTTQAKDDEIYYIHNQVGYNFRLTNIHAALGVAQLEKLSEFINIKKENYFFYKERIDQITGLHLTEVPKYAENNYWMYAMLIEQAHYGKSRDEVMNNLAQKGIQTRPVWHLNHLQKPYINCQSYMIEKAPEMVAKTLNIPCSVNLKKEDIEYIIQSLVI